MLWDQVAATQVNNCVLQQSICSRTVFYISLSIYDTTGSYAIKTINQVYGIQPPYFHKERELRYILDLLLFQSSPICYISYNAIKTNMSIIAVQNLGYT
jgi:hypothetical protein